MKRAELKPRRPSEVTRDCEVCGEPFTYTYVGGALRKTCSPTHAHELTRRANIDRRGVANPNWRGGGSAGRRDRKGEARWYATPRDWCGACGGKGGMRGIALHHVIYRQHVRREGGDEWDPRNAMPLCDSCHSRHHRRSVVVPVERIPASAFEFALDLLGTAADDYFRRYYRAAPKPDGIR